MRHLALINEGSADSSFQLVYIAEPKDLFLLVDVAILKVSVALYGILQPVFFRHSDLIADHTRLLHRFPLIGIHLAACHMLPQPAIERRLGLFIDTEEDGPPQ